MPEHPVDPQRRRLLSAGAGLAALLCLPRSAWSSTAASPDTRAAAAGMTIADFQRLHWQDVAISSVMGLDSKAACYSNAGGRREA